MASIVPKPLTGIGVDSVTCSAIFSSYAITWASTLPSVVSTAAGLLILPFDTAWTVPSLNAWALMVASAICVVFATIFITVGLRTGEIAVVAPFRYVPVPLALLLGYNLWGDVPDQIAWVGIALVLSAGLYTLHRERASLKRKVAEAAAE